MHTRNLIFDAITQPALLHRGRGLGLNAIGCDLRPCLRPAMRPATCCHLSCHMSSVIIVRYDLSGFALTICAMKDTTTCMTIEPWMPAEDKNASLQLYWRHQLLMSLTDGTESCPAHHHPAHPAPAPAPDCCRPLLHYHPRPIRRRPPRRVLRVAPREGVPSAGSLRLRPRRLRARLVLNGSLLLRRSSTLDCAPRASASAGRLPAMARIRCSCSSVAAPWPRAAPR